VEGRLRHEQARTIREQGQGGPPTCLDRGEIECCASDKIANNDKLATARRVGEQEPL
jgi:hypothetical protein